MTPPNATGKEISLNAPIYIVASPGLRSTRFRWPRQLAELQALMPGTRFVSWTDLPEAFAAVPREERPARLARAMSAAVLIPDKLGPPPRRWVGRTALAEAEAFVSSGKPGHFYIAGELLAWDEVDLVAHTGSHHPPRQRTEVIAPRFRESKGVAA
jgi:hypothetical protein